ncbi:MAG: energy transducer TonB, partial [Gammaproteobacteria bacterium]|nr:energy transducer TonB [Gammaproteobacteria bacterium]
AATIIARLPNHGGARELEAAVANALAPPPPEPEPELEAVADAAEPAAAVISPAELIPDMHAAFRDAMARNALLAPAGSNARDIVEEMLALAPDHELAEAARLMLVTEMLDRSAQSIEALDVTAATTWIDSAEPLSRDAGEIARARERVTEHLIDIESQRRMPASALELRHYVAPEYPRLPLARGLEGWVELEFTVATDGRIEDVEVTSSSHPDHFVEEAVEAVAEWEFEPVVYMDRTIPKRSYTRVAFVLD